MGFIDVPVVLAFLFVYGMYGGKIWVDSFADTALSAFPPDSLSGFLLYWSVFSVLFILMRILSCLSGFILNKINKKDDDKNSFDDTADHELFDFKNV